MTASKPYTQAVVFSRPAGRKRIEVFSPKLARRLSLGGYDAYRTWLVIEANPRIKAFCERPTWLSLSNPQKSKIRPNHRHLYPA